MSILYKPLHDDGEEKEAGLSLLSLEGNDSFSDISSIRTTSRSTIIQLLYCLAMFLGGVLLTTTFFLSNPSLSRRPTYEKGFSEEKILPSSLIQLEQRQFVSPVDFQENGTEYLVITPGEKAYVGATNPEIDRAWEELLWGRYFSLSEAEAKELWGADYHLYYDRDSTGYTGGFDMFHQLHCLNQIRQALHRDYYPMMAVHGPVHLDHCINHLRQAIQCWGNTAITPIRWFEGYHHGYVQSNTVHTCRKFEPIREYVSERFNGSLKVPREGKSAKDDDNAF